MSPYFYKPTLQHSEINDLFKLRNVYIVLIYKSCFPGAISSGCVAPADGLLLLPVPPAGGEHHQRPLLSEHVQPDDAEVPG